MTDQDRKLAEVRDAAVFACMRFELLRVAPVVIEDKETYAQFIARYRP
jgi:hypothetical protein